MGRWTLGAEARARFALGAQHGAQAKAEPTFDLLAGPVAAATLGSIAIFAGAGPTLLRAGGTSTLGVTGLAGLGAARRPLAVRKAFSGGARYPFFFQSASDLATSPSMKKLPGGPF